MKKYFISYHLLFKNGESSFGDVIYSDDEINLGTWKKKIAEQCMNVNRVTILFFKEIEE